MEEFEKEKNIFLNEGVVEKEKRKKFWHCKKGEMKIDTSPNQKLIDFVFIGVFVCGKISWVEEIDWEVS